MSVPTNEVRNTLERNPGLRSPLGIPPPLDTALYIYTFIHLNIYTIIHLYDCINTFVHSYSWEEKESIYMLPVQSHGERGLVDGSLQCVLKFLGVDEGTGSVKHLAFAEQDDTGCIQS